LLKLRQISTTLKFDSFWHKYVKDNTYLCDVHLFSPHLIRVNDLPC